MKLFVIIIIAILVIVAGIAVIERIFYRKHDKSPGSMAYIIFFILVRLGFINRKKPVIEDSLMASVKTPYIMLVNHESFEDFYYVWQMIKKHKPDYIINEYYTRLPFLKWLALHGGVLSKKLFTREMSTGIKIHRMLKKGYPVVIFPEGRLSPDGRSNPVVEKGAGLYRRMKCDLVLTKIEGAYYAHPKWRKKYFRSPVKVSVKKVIHPEELKNMTDEGLEELIEKTLYTDASLYDHGPYPQKNKAIGLEGILYRCIFCGEKYSTTGKGNELLCTACGKKLVLDSKYHFTEWPHSIPGYYEEIKNTERKELVNKKLEMKVELRVFGQSGRIEKKEAGICFLDGENFSYHSETEKLEISVSDLSGIAFSCKKEIELYRGENLYYFYPLTDKVQVAEWALFIDLLTEKRGA